MKLKLLLVFVCILLCQMAQSCKIGRIKNEIEAIIGKEVEILTGMQSIMCGKDTVVDYSMSSLKMVVLFKDIYCTSCQVSQMDEWNDFVKIAESSNGKFQMLFIFSPRDDSELVELHQAVMLSEFHYPLTVDYNMSFISENPAFLEKYKFQAALLDSDNRIIAVGNPMMSEKLKLYYIDLIRDNM